MVLPIGTWKRVSMVNQAAEERVAYKAYHLTLPKGASPKQRRYFEKKIELSGQLNPDWAVISDWPRPGEKEAYAIIRKDKK